MSILIPIFSFLNEDGHSGEKESKKPQEQKSTVILVCSDEGLLQKRNSNLTGGETPELNVKHNDNKEKYINKKKSGSNQINDHQKDHLKTASNNASSDATEKTPHKKGTENIPH